MILKARAKKLVEKYSLHIMEWRDEMGQATWEAITNEICTMEKLPKERWPSHAAIRSAWHVYINNLGRK